MDTLGVVEIKSDLTQANLNSKLQTKVTSAQTSHRGNVVNPNKLSISFTGRQSPIIETSSFNIASAKVQSSATNAGGFQRRGSNKSENLEDMDFQKEIAHQTINSS